MQDYTAFMLYIAHEMNVFCTTDERQGQKFDQGKVYCELITLIILINVAKSVRYNEIAFNSTYNC